MNSSRNSFEMMCFSRFIILQRCGYAIFICSKSCKLLAFKRSREKWGADGITAVAYIASPVDVTKGSIMVDGSQTTALGVLSAGSVKFADKSLLMVDASAVMGNKAAITGVKSANVADASKL